MRGDAKTSDGKHFSAVDVEIRIQYMDGCYPHSVFSNPATLARTAVIYMCQ